MHVYLYSECCTFAIFAFKTRFQKLHKIHTESTVRRRRVGRGSGRSATVSLVVVALGRARFPPGEIFLSPPGDIPSINTRRSGGVQYYLHHFCISNLCIQKYDTAKERVCHME